MALARSRNFLQENIMIGNALLKPTSKIYTRSLPTRNQLLLRSPQHPLGMSRALSTFCNKSLYTTPKSTFITKTDFSFMSERQYATSNPQGVHLTEEVEINKLIFGPAKKNQRGGLFVPINYNTQRETLRLQTPVLRIPFGLTSFENSAGFSLNVSFDQLDTNPQIKKFHDFINKFDDYVIKNAVAHAKDWFPGKNISAEVIRANFRRNVKEPKDVKYSPLMKFKIPYVKEQADVEVYLGNEAEPATTDALINNSMIVCVIEPRSIWFVSGNFGVTWTVRQTKIVEQPRGEQESKLSSYSFRDADIVMPTRKFNDGQNAVSPNPPPPVASEEDFNVDDSSEQAVQAEEVEDVEEIVVAPPKKTSAKASSPVTPTTVKQSMKSSPPPSSTKQATTVASKTTTTGRPESTLPKSTTTASKPVTTNASLSANKGTSKIVSKTVSTPIKSAVAPKKK